MNAKLLLLCLSCVALAALGGCGLPSETDTIEIPAGDVSAVTFEPAPTPTNSSNSGSVPAPTPVAVKPTCLADENGNWLKAFPRSASAVITTISGEFVRPAKLLETLYIFPGEAPDGVLLVGADPYALAAEGCILAGDCYVSPTAMCVRLKPETRAIRKLVDLYTPWEAFARQLDGEASEPSFTESASKSSWLHVLETKDHELAGSTVKCIRVLTLAWTPVSVASLGLPTPDELSQVRQLDLILSLDGTQSMDASFDALRDCLAEVLERLMASGCNVRIGLLVFRDHDERSEWPSKFFGFREDLTSLEADVASVRAQGGADWPEPAFQQVNQLLVEDGLWRPGAFRSVFLLTDNESKFTATGAADDVLGEEGKSMVETCRRDGVVIHAMKAPFNPRFTGDPTLAIRQMKAITDQTGGAVHVLHQDSPETIAAALVAVSSQLAGDARLDTQIVEEVAAGKSIDEICRDLGLAPPAFKARLDRAKKRLGGDAARIVTPSGSVSAESGWTVFNSVAFEAGVLVERRQVMELISILDKLLTDGPDRPESLATLWGGSLQMAVGDDQALSDNLRRRGLPVLEGLLSVSFAELMTMPLHARRLFAADIVKKYETLVDAERTMVWDESGKGVLPWSVVP